MPRIAVLASAVADQIAAGEVVERPASAVKELVENAFDAGATSIEIDVEDGGRALIRVSDDGCGMERADAQLAIERHATSKIQGIADLVGVASFGFRGEALPAIASVSRLELVTATSDGGGTGIWVAGGHVERIADAARRRGTTVTVSQLFFNTPARRKFLRSARSEWRAIAEALVTLSLVRRDVHLTATHDGKPAISLPPAATLRDRVAAIWGASYAARFVVVDSVVGPLRLQGLAERPGDVGTATRRVTLIVNGRAVRDNGVMRAAESAYRSALSPGLRPALLLELTLPGDAVDVNVHPAKAEVRFHERWTVERAVEQAVRRALGMSDAAASLGSRPVLSWSPSSPSAGGWNALPPVTADQGPLFEPDEQRSTATTAAPDEGDLPITVPPLLQLRNTYIMYEAAEGVVLVDQHSAHERVLYERFAREFAAGGAGSQRLLLPETLHLNPAEGDAFDANREALHGLGYEIESFGGHTVIIHAVPTPHPRFDALGCLRETLAALAGDRLPAAHARHERLIATIACKAAVKAGDALSTDEMRALYRALAGTALPAHDVHGRSTVVHLSWDEVERRFGRR